MTALSIAARELRNLFLSPLAWAVLAVVQFLVAYLFLSQLDQYLALQGRLLGIDGAPGVTDLVGVPVLGTTAIVMLLATPMLTMRLISEERRSGTITLLLSSPLTPGEIVLGKFLGIAGFMVLIATMVLMMPLSLAAGTDLDYGKLASGYLGLVLLLASFAAAGLYVSTLTAQPTVAGMATFGLLLLLWIIDWDAGNEDAGASVVDYLSITHHYEGLVRGLVKTSDLGYFAIFIGLFLALAARHLEARRLKG